MSANLDDATALHLARQMPRWLREEARRWHPTEPETLITYRAADVIEALLRMLPVDAPAPEAKEMVLYGTATMGWGQTPMRHDTHRLTLPTLDGALIPGEYIGPGGVITVTEVR